MMVPEVSQETAVESSRPKSWDGVNFIIIGAMKSGTTTFFEYLCRHPRVFMTTPKEPQFFSMRYDDGPGWAGYKRLFEVATKSGQLCGEASTCYSRWPHYGDVAGRIAKHLPNVKLIYLIRHPVQRAYSHYGHRMREWAIQGDRPVVSFEEALEVLPEVVDASLYITQIRQYLEHFDRDRLLVVTLEDLHRDTRSFFQGVQKFLDIEPVDLTAAGPIVANPKDAAYARSHLRLRIEKIRRLPVLAGALDILPKGFKQSLRNWVLRPKVATKLAGSSVETHLKRLTPLTDSTRQQLLARFAEPTRQLEAFLGRPLPDWFV